MASDYLKKMNPRYGTTDPHTLSANHVAVIASAMPLGSPSRLAAMRRAKRYRALNRNAWRARVRHAAQAMRDGSISQDDYHSEAAIAARKLMVASKL